MIVLTALGGDFDGDIFSFDLARCLATIVECYVVGFRCGVHFLTATLDIALGGTLDEALGVGINSEAEHYYRQSGESEQEVVF